jgi:hypothetical protein
MVSSKWLVASGKILLIGIIGIQTMSCTHWLIETQTRIQVENSTSDKISDLCIVSKNGQKDVLVPGSIGTGKKSDVHEIELVGEFDFMIHAGDDWKPQPLGIHKLKGGSVWVKITEKDGKFAMTLK